MILKPIDETFEIPEPQAASDIWEYLAKYNCFQFYETDNKGFVPNELVRNYFMINKTELVSPRTGTDERVFDGVLFFGVPADPSLDVHSPSPKCDTQNFDNYTFDNFVFAEDWEDDVFKHGQYKMIIYEILGKEFYNTLKKYFKCSNFEFSIINMRPLYNSNKYTLSTNSSGVEITYKLWI
jgi:hypothetical protein